MANNETNNNVELKQLKDIISNLKQNKAHIHNIHSFALPLGEIYIEIVNTISVLENLVLKEYKFSPADFNTYQNHITKLSHNLNSPLKPNEIEDFLEKLSNIQQIVKRMKIDETDPIFKIQHELLAYCASIQFFIDLIIRFYARNDQIAKTTYKNDSFYARANIEFTITEYLSKLKDYFPSSPNCDNPVPIDIVVTSFFDLSTKLRNELEVRLKPLEQDTKNQTTNKLKAPLKQTPPSANKEKLFHKPVEQGSKDAESKGGVNVKKMAEHFNKLATQEQASKSPSNRKR